MTYAYSLPLHMGGIRRSSRAIKQELINEQRTIVELMRMFPLGSLFAKRFPQQPAEHATTQARPPRPSTTVTQNVVAPPPRPDAAPHPVVAPHPVAAPRPKTTPGNTRRLPHTLSKTSPACSPPSRTWSLLMGSPWTSARCAMAAGRNNSGVLVGVRVLERSTNTSRG